MNLLLDSHALLWALHAPGKLDRLAVDAIRNARNTVLVSAASVWELELKAAKGKLMLPDTWLAAVEKAGFVQIPVTSSEAQTSARLPWHHADPFDRLLVAQAIERRLTIVTRDSWIAAYDVAMLHA